MTPPHILESQIKSVSQMEKQSDLPDNIQQYDPPNTKSYHHPAIQIIYRMRKVFIGDHIQSTQLYFQPEVAHVHHKERKNQKPHQSHVPRSPGSTSGRFHHISLCSCCFIFASNCNPHDCMQ